MIGMKIDLIGMFVVAVLGLGAGGLGGCTSVRSTADAQVLDAGAVLIEIEGASYDEVFAATREVLSGFRFGINRVDASRGVITTFPKRTAGLASIWDREQSSLGQEIEDLTNQQERAIRVEFESQAESETDGSGVGAGVRARVEVVVSRVHRPHWRVESESIRFSTHARSRDVDGRVEAREFREPIGQDVALAKRVADEIARRFE